MNRIRKLRKQKGISVPKLAEMLNITPKHFYDLETGKRRLHEDIIKKLAEIFNVSTDYLLGHINNPRASQQNATLSDAIPVGDLVRVPVYGEIRAGQPMFVQEEIIGYEYVPAEDVKGGGYFFLQVKGDSMINARIHEDDLVLVRKQDTLENGQIGVVIVDGEATIKKYYRRGMMVVLKPENPSYEPIIAPVTDVRIVGEVVEAKIKFNGR